MRRWLVWLPVVLVLALAALAALLFRPAGPPVQREPKPRVSSVPSPAAMGTLRLGAYEVRWQEEPTGQCPKAFLEVSRQGKRVYFQEGGTFAVGRGFRESWTSRPGVDVTGNGVPDLVFESNTMGNACCIDLHILELGPVFREVGDLGTGQGGTDFRDLNRDGRPEVILGDGTFFGWRTSNAASPVPSVVLALHEGRYRPSPLLMLRAAPTARQMDALVAHVQERKASLGLERDPLLAALIGNVVDLLYSGNDRAARRLLERVVPDASARQAYHRAILEQAKTSPYWPAVAELNGFQ